MTDSILDKIKLTQSIFNTMCEAKIEHLAQICNKYNWNINDFKNSLYKKLKDSNMHVGACNLTIDFIIIAVKEDEVFNNDYNYKKIITEQILGAAIYYANCEGKNPIYE